jgi:hypothetical protein
VAFSQSFRNYHVETGPEDFFRGPTEEAASRTVPEHDDSVRVANHDRIRQILDQSTEGTCVDASVKVLR